MDSFVTLLPDNYLRLMIKCKLVKFLSIFSKMAFCIAVLFALYAYIK